VARLTNSPYAVLVDRARRSSWHAGLKSLARSDTPAGHSLRRESKRRVDAMLDVACKAPLVPLPLIPPPANPSAVPCVARPPHLIIPHSLQRGGRRSLDAAACSMRAPRPPSAVQLAIGFLFRV
jgi:hypothetical protein